MRRLVGQWYPRLGFGSRALWSSRLRATISSILVIGFVAAQLWILLADISGWALWIMPAIAVVTWFALGSFWLTRDLVDAQIDAELRDILDAADPRR